MLDILSTLLLTVNFNSCYFLSTIVDKKSAIVESKLIMYRNDLIKAKKAAKGLTNEDLCKGAKLSPMTVTKILAGEENIELTSLQRLAAYLEIALEDLFSQKEVENVI